MGLSVVVSGFMQREREGVLGGCNLGKWRGARPVILYVRRTDRQTDRPSQFRGCAPIYILIDLLHPAKLGLTL
jgi:hypothetical protein